MINQGFLAEISIPQNYTSTLQICMCLINDNLIVIFIKVTWRQRDRTNSGPGIVGLNFFLRCFWSEIVIISNRLA